MGEDHTARSEANDIGCLDAGALAHEGDGFVRARDDHLGEREQELPVRGAFHVPTVALEEPRAQLTFQARYLTAQRRLGEIE